MTQKNNDYSIKLKEFNNTIKYERELHFLLGLIGTRRKSVLDFGCGNGFAVDYFNYLGCEVSGFDLNPWNPDFKYVTPNEKPWEVVYFMHSIAHIMSVEIVLKSLKTEEIVIITPNKDFIELQKNDNYKPDLSVLEHYNQQDLTSLLERCGYEIEISGSFGKIENGLNERIFIKAKKKDQ